MITIAICDDNPMYLKLLCQNIKKAFQSFTNDFRIVSFDNGKLLLQEHSISPFDIVFLDIDMPDMSGFDVAKSMRDNSSNCFLIFVTSYSEFVYQSFDFRPFHFIRKLPEEMLEGSVQDVVKLLMEHMKQYQQIILTDDLHGKVITYYRNILFIKSEKHYLYFFLKDETEPVKMRGKLTDLENELDKYDFVRVHRNYIINLNGIQRIDLKVGTVYLSNHREIKRIPLSRKLMKTVDEKYTNYLRRTL